MTLLQTQYYPIAWPWLALLGLLFVVLVAIIEIGILDYAYEKMGIPARWVMAALLGSLVGSAINIPIAQLPPENLESGRIVSFYGMHYIVPVVHHSPGTIIAINVGGAVIPILLSLYLMARNHFLGQALAAIAVVAVVVHQLAVPVRGLGISVPIFVPPIIAAITAMLIGWRRAAPLAYICGTLGTLIGADIMNLARVRGLGAPIASIGGAGTFDGVFLTGIIAVLLVPASRPRRRT